MNVHVHEVYCELLNALSFTLFRVRSFGLNPFHVWAKLARRIRIRKFVFLVLLEVFEK